MLLCLAFLALLTGASAPFDLPGAIDDGDRYRAAVPCATDPATPTTGPPTDCRDLVEERLEAVHVTRSKGADWVVVEPLSDDPGAAQAGRRRIDVTDARRLSQVFHPGDQVTVTWWEGEPTAVTDAGQQVESDSPPTAQAPLDLTATTCLLLLAVLLGWAAVRRLRGLGRRSQGALPPAAFLLIAVAIGGAIGTGERSLLLVGVLQGLVLVPASVLLAVRNRHRRRHPQRR
ncbi:hypothetical protein GCM10009665_20110 [Kitasatospora nipponensis]|uniref:Integral membrane protein n=1 Tax=Kitasatospora nipponensis TaxID=258049 RepID=A0ABP4GPM5_9ACTN